MGSLITKFVTKKRGLTRIVSIIDETMHSFAKNLPTAISCFSDFHKYRLQNTVEADSSPHTRSTQLNAQRIYRQKGQCNALPNESPENWRYRKRETMKTLQKPFRVFTSRRSNLALFGSSSLSNGCAGEKKRCEVAQGTSAPFFRFRYPTRLRCRAELRCHGSCRGTD